MLADAHVRFVASLIGSTHVHTLLDMRMDSSQIPPAGPDLADLLERRSGEAMALNQRYLNRQLGRVVQTLGFDREWVRGRGRT